MNGTFSVNQPYEYGVERKNDKKLKTKKHILIALYIIYALAFVFIIITFLPGLVPVIAVMPLTLLALILTTWKRTQITNEYTCVSGGVTFSRIYGGKSRHEMLKFNIKDCTRISPLDRHERERLTSLYPASLIYDGLSSPSSPDAYFAEIDDGETKCVYLFDATNRMLKICRFYNPAATNVASVRY